MQRTDGLRRLEELYARIPKVKCRRGCSECCGPVIWSRLEWERLPEEMRKNATSLRCPFSLPDGGCEVYELRPVVCRLFGVVKRMACPYSGQERFLTKEEENAIIAAYSDILRY
jgi:uncharacterized protein